MPNHLSDNHDLLFYLNAAGAHYPPPPADGASGGSKERTSTKASSQPTAKDEERYQLYLSYLEKLGALAAESIAPRSHAIDREGFEFKDGEIALGESLMRSISELRALGAPHLPFSRSHRGSGASLSVQLVETELLARAELSVAIQNNLYGGFAMALLIGASAAERAELTASAAHLRALAKRAGEREIFGAIALHEPRDEGRAPLIDCAAELGEDGAYTLRGEKSFVVGAGAPFLLVLARDEAAIPGEKGERISFFLVDAAEERAAGRLKITSALRRLGHRGIPSASIRLEGVIARRIGDERSGPRLLAFYQAGMRLFHAFECIGLAESAFRSGMRFAWETPFRGKALVRHELIAATLDEMELDLRSMRALAMSTAWHQGIAMEGLLSGEFDDEIVLHHRDRARRLTSYLKYYVDSKALEITQRVAQIRGAEGFCEGAAEEKYLRDAATLPFDEGMSRTESLLAIIKVTVGALLKNPQEHVRQGARARWRTVSPRDPLEKRVARLDLLGQNAQQHLLLRTAGEKMKGLRDRPISDWTAELTRSWDPERDFAFATIHAERLTRLLAEIGISEIFLSQSLDDPSRRELLERHLERAEPVARMLYEELSIRGKRIIDDPDR